MLQNDFNAADSMWLTYWEQLRKELLRDVIHGTSRPYDVFDTSSGSIVPHRHEGLVPEFHGAKASIVAPGAFSWVHVEIPQVLL